MTRHSAGDLRAQLADQAEHNARRLTVAMIAGITRTLARTWQALGTRAADQEPGLCITAAPNAVFGAAPRKTKRTEQQA
jgi:hypothetical protein